MNRAELYGDGFFETIRIEDNRPLLWDLHLKRIEFALKILKFENVRFFISVFASEVLTTLSKTGIQSGRCRISFSRTGEGYYIPTNQSFEYNIEIAPLYIVNKPVNIGIYPDGMKAKSPFTPIKTSSALLFVLAGIYAKEHQWDDILILNQYDRICEALSSNIFIVTGDQIFTPPLSELCVNGVMRTHILENFANSFNIKEKPISTEELNHCDEIWLTNAVQGIRSIHSYNGKELKINQASELYRQIKSSLRNS